MKKSLYFSLMRETSDLVYPLLLAKLDDIRDIDNDLQTILRYIINKRNNQHLLLKPYLLRLTYELCGGTDWTKTIPVSAAFELLNISSYQANSSFDNKHNVLSSRQKNSQFIAAMVTREACLELLALAIADFGAETINAIANDLSICNKHIYIAQHFDLNVLTVHNLPRYTDASIYMTDYTKRCLHGSGIFSGLCAHTGGFLAKASGEALSAVKIFGEEFGTGLHVMNDLADFVPPGTGFIGHNFKDQFSDLKNGRLTLGCYQLFTSSTSEGKVLTNQVLTGHSFDKYEFREIAALMVKEGIVDFIKKHAIKYEKKAKKALHFFPNCRAKSLLSMMVKACHQNKFTKALSLPSKVTKGD